MRNISIMVSLLILAGELSAVNAPPGLRTFTQPDGVKFQGRIHGDEWAGWVETESGWTVVKNAAGWWVYAQGIDGHRCLPGDALAGRDEPPAVQLDGQPLLPHLRPLRRQVVDPAPSPRLNQSRTDTFQVPVLSVEFPDYAATHPITNLSALLNADGYGHPGYPGSGSFREFYQEISYDAFRPVSQVADWITAPHPHDYYAYANPNGYPHVLELVRAIVDSAEAAGMDWTQFDNDGDGWVDALNVIHAGPGAEEGDHSNIWSHKWSLSAGGLAVQYDGVWIDAYTINPEIQNNNIVAIGVISHEFGHALGLPDLYDTDYSSSGAGKLALMASGSWGTSGNTPWYPSAMCAWSKVELDWAAALTLNADSTGVPVVQSYTSNRVYQVDHPNDDSEYWLIENRQQTGTDVLMSEPGLLIWHIDTEKTGGWGVNNDEPHYGVGLEQADGLFELENGGSSNGGDPYPGTTDNHDFNNSSNPSSISYYGIPSMLGIENISYPDSVMTFDLVIGEYLIGTITADYSSGFAYDTGSVVIAVENPTPLATLRFRLVSDPGILQVTGGITRDRASADSISITVAGGISTIELVNPYIPVGNGPVLELSLFASTSRDHSVELTFANQYAQDTSQSEVGLIGGMALYQVIARPQVFRLDSAAAPPGGYAGYDIQLRNTVPLKMMMITLADDPNHLIPVDEFYTDSNGNHRWDMGEPYEDWNGDGVWTPAVATTARTQGWTYTSSNNQSATLIAASNWNDPLEPGEGPVFRIHVLVDGTAPPGPVQVSITSANLMDVFGIVGVPYQAVPMIFTITEDMASAGGTGLPQMFHLGLPYPNPFNPTAQLEYSLPERSDLNFWIYDITGKTVWHTRQRQHPPGNFTLTWNGRDQSGQLVSSGLYFIYMECSGFREGRKLVLVR